MRKNIKGVALLWTLLISMVLLTISGTMVNFIIKDSRFTVNIEDSVKAYAIAKSGLDWGNWYKKTNNLSNNNYLFNIDSNIVRVVISADSVTSTAYVNGVERSLRTKYSELVKTAVIPSTNLSPNTEGFTFWFDFWGSVAGDADFGLKNDSSVPALFVNVNSGNAKLCMYYNNPSLVISCSEPISLSGANPTEPYNLRAEINYIDGSSASLKVSKRTIIDEKETYVSLGSRHLSVPDSDWLGDLKYLFYPAGSYVSSGGSQGDGEYIQIGSLYFDKAMIAKY